jgi:hypothetical protein
VPLPRGTDKVDARVLAELRRRDLVPSLWVPSLDERALRERRRRRMHLVRLRAAMNRGGERACRRDRLSAGEREPRCPPRCQLMLRDGTAERCPWGLAGTR